VGSVEDFFPVFIHSLKIHENKEEVIKILSGSENRRICNIEFPLNFLDLGRTGNKQKSKI
jgi:hypothetical protein